MDDVPDTGTVTITIPDILNLADAIFNIRLRLLKAALIKIFPNVGKHHKGWSYLRKIGRVAFKFLTSKYLLAFDIGRRVACHAWHSTTGVTNNDRLPPCPCNLEQMSVDGRYIKEKLFQFLVSKFFFRKFQARSCYRQTTIRYFS